MLYVNNDTLDASGLVVNYAKFTQNVFYEDLSHWAVARILGHDVAGFAPARFDVHPRAITPPRSMTRRVFGSPTGVC